jgi:hypothetical protein
MINLDAKKRGFTLHIQYRDYEWESPYKDTFARRMQVYDPFQTRDHVPLDKVDSLLAPIDGPYELV